MGQTEHEFIRTAAKSYTEVTGLPVGATFYERMYQWGVSTGALDRRCTLNGLRSSVNRATGKLVWDATSQRTVSFAQVGSASKKLKEGEDASSGAKVEDQYLTLKLVRGVTEAGSLQFGADDLQDQVLKMPGKTLEDHVGVLFAANGRPVRLKR